MGLRRLLYNYDAWGPFLKGHSAERIHENIDVFSGTQVTTVMLSPNVGQSLSYPSEVGEMCHWRPLSAEERNYLSKGMGEPFARAAEGVAEMWRNKGIDSFGLLVERAVTRGFETLASFRMNDLHMVRMLDSQGPYVDAFYRTHPEWRLPASWGLNYAISEVRQYRLAQLEELLRRYPFAGLELDFLRRPPYFPPDGGEEAYAGATLPTRRLSHFLQDMAEDSVPVMTEFVGKVREMTLRVAREKGRKILLAARVPSSLSGCRRLGLDPVAWHRRGYLDFLTVSHFLHLFFGLLIADFKSALPGLAVYGCLDYIVGGPMIDGYLYARDATAEIYKGAAAALYAQGADGIYLFNMYVCRGNGPDPKRKDWSHDEPFQVLKVIGDPQTLEDEEKLYLVDSRFEPFDNPFFDVRAQLPAETLPEAPLVVTMWAGERKTSGKKATLRVVAAGLAPETKVAVQLNGQGQGMGRKAAQPHLYREEYDQLPPDPASCVDFSVSEGDLKFGPNEIVVLSSSPVTIRSIEMAIAAGKGRS